MKNVGIKSTAPHDGVIVEEKNAEDALRGLPAVVTRCVVSSVAARRFLTTTGEKSAENATVAVSRWTTHPIRSSIGQDIESKHVG